MDGRPQVGFVTGDAFVGWLRVFFVTGDASVEWKVAEMGCCRPTVVPSVSRVAGALSAVESWADLC